MGDRYILHVHCECGHIDQEAYYAPTCGFWDWECPECHAVIDLEEYSGIPGESCASTNAGLKAVEEYKKRKMGEGAE